MAEIEVTVEFPVDRGTFLEREVEASKPTGERAAPERALERRREVGSVDAIRLSLRLRRTVHSLGDCADALHETRRELHELPKSIRQLAGVDHTLAAVGWQMLTRGPRRSFGE